MVPMAPSSTRMRCLSKLTNSDRTLFSDITVLLAYARLVGNWPASGRAGGRDEVGAIHRVEVEGRDAAIDQIEHLLGGNSRSNQLACRGIIIEALKPPGDPAGY